MHLEIWQWLILYASALLIGISKTAVPGVGILVVTSLAYGFGGRASVGIMLPMLVISDIFAVSWYRHHAQWDKLNCVVPGVVIGLAFGAVGLRVVGQMQADKDILGIVIGVLTLVMLTIHLLKNRLPDRLTPTSPLGIAATGIFAGFSTMVSNAAGPVMSIYMAAHKLPKKEFVGTLAWFFFVLNLSKLPVYIYLSATNPSNPIITTDSAMLALYALPALALGALAGKLMLPRISQKAFETVVLVLAAIGAVRLLV